MGRHPTLNYPAEAELIKLVKSCGSIRRAAMSLGHKGDEPLRKYINRRPKLRDAVYSVLPPQNFTGGRYPPRETLVSLMDTHKTYKALASALGVTRGSLRDFLSTRPDLKAELEDHKWYRQKYKDKPSSEVIAQNNAQAKKRWRANNPERVREINRKWAKHQDPSSRASWNHYNRERRLSQDPLPNRSEVPDYLYNDPCSYCSGKGGTTDHIVPVSSGGVTREDNLTAACHSCNCSKNAKDLLSFLLSRKT